MSRASKSGDAYRTEKKFEERYDQEEELGTPHRLMEWISETLSGEGEAPTDDSWKGISDYLRDGTVLCRLLNELRSSAGMSPVKFKKNAKMTFAMMNNLENFNNGAQEYGIPETALFQSVDLVEGRKAPMVNVINCLNHLGFTANEKGFSPKYDSPAPPKVEY